MSMIFFAGEHNKNIYEINKALSKSTSMRDLGTVKKIIEMKIIRDLYN